MAFFSSGKLKKVDISGGPPQTVCSAEGTGHGGSWSGDGTILFAAGTEPIRRVRAAGGASTPVTKLDRSTEVLHTSPQFLPDGRHFIYWLQARSPDPEKNSVVVASLDDKPDSVERRRLLPSTSRALYAAGYLLFEREGVLMAQPFDATGLQLRGEPVPVADSVGLVTARYGWSAFSVSAEGTLVYSVGADTKTELAWIDRSGKQVGRVGEPGDQLAPKLSPDEKRLAVALRDAQGQLDVWLIDLTRDTSTRFTFREGLSSIPIWSPDSGNVLFNSNRSGVWDLYQKASSGSGIETLLLKSSESKLPTDWSPDGRYVLYETRLPKTGYDLWALPLEGDRTPRPVIQTEFDQVNGQFSPDGRWIAYESDESTRSQIYVQAFLTSSGKFQISTNGGSRPRWRRDGKELFYLSPDRKMMAVEVTATATTFEAARPRELFQTRATNAPFVAPTYDVAANGQRFLINSTLDGIQGPPLNVVMHWAPK